MPKCGDVIGDRYRLISLVAKGGMGAVWRAEHLELGVPVALKVLLESAHTPSAERRFRQEAQAAARLRSPHVVQVQDFGVVDGQAFLVMELLAGEDLAARIEARGPLTPPAGADILDGVSAAIQLAHESGIIHRDLKPANIFLAMVGAAEVVKVLDFGVAKIDGAGAKAGSTTGAGLVGSPGYMSPEQVWAEPLTPATDLWSLGVVALEMLVGHNPFDEGPLARVFQRIVSDDIPRVRALKPGLPSGFDAFFDRALARDPKERFESALALAAAFRAACSTAVDEGSAPPLPATNRVTRETSGETAPPIDAAATLQRPEMGAPPPRKRMRGALVGATFLAVASGASILWATMKQAPSATLATAEQSLPPSSSPSTPLAPPGEEQPGEEQPGEEQPSAAPSHPASAAVTAPPGSASAAPSRRTARPPAAPPPSPVASDAAPPAKPSASHPSVDPIFGIPVSGH